MPPKKEAGSKANKSKQVEKKIEKNHDNDKLGQNNANSNIKLKSNDK